MSCCHERGAEIGARVGIVIFLLAVIPPGRAELSADEQNRPRIAIRSGGVSRIDGDNALLASCGQVPA
jgi:hypothetical protein